MLPVNSYARTIRNGGGSILVSSTYEERDSRGNLAGYQGTGNYVGWPLTLPSDAFISTMYQSQIGVVMNEARANLAANVDDVTWDSPQDFLEGEKTARMFAQRVRDAERFVVDFKKRNKKLLRTALRHFVSERTDRFGTLSTRPGITYLASRKTVQLARDLNNMYLEFNFGWKPLMYSMEDLGMVVAKQIAPSTRQKTAGHAFWADENRVRNLNVTVPYSAAPSIDYDLVTKFRIDYWFGGYLIQSGDANWRDQMGLNAANIVPTMWELTTFSFVADYVSNMGDFIRNISNSARKLEPSSLYMSRKVVYERSYENLFIRKWTPRAGDSIKQQNHIQFMGSPVKEVIFSRIPVTRTDLLVRFNLKPASAGQLVNVLSLIGGLLSGFAGKVRI